MFFNAKKQWSAILVLLRNNNKNSNNISNNISYNLCIAREVLFNSELSNEGPRSNSKVARAFRKFVDQKISFFIKYTFEFYGLGEGGKLASVQVLYFLKTASTTSPVSVKHDHDPN